MTRKSKPKSACVMCKWHKYLGNNKERRPISDRRKTQPDERRPPR